MATVSLRARVAFVSSHARLGGSESYLETVIRGLDPSSVHAVVCLEEGPFVTRLRRLGHSPLVVPVGPRPHHLIAGARRLGRLFEKERPDVVHANGVKAALACALIPRRRRPPILWLKHDFSWDGPLAGFIARRCARIVGVSRAVLKSLEGRWGDKMQVVHAGTEVPAIDRETTRATTLESLGLSGNGPVVTLMGRMHPAKGQMELVEAVPSVLARHDAARFLLVGEEDPFTPDYAQRIRARVDALGLREHVRFSGYREDAGRVLAASDVVVIPSVPDERGMGREGFSLVALEALASGTTVVGYDDGGLPEVVGPCGVLVAPGDRGALAEAIARVLDDGAMRREKADCGRERVARQFTKPGMLHSLIQAYEEAAGLTR